MKKLLITLLCLLALTTNVSAISDTYYIYDQSIDGHYVASFNSRKEAIDYYNQNKDKYDNLVLYLNDEVLLMEYGVVEFKTNDSCDYLVKISNRKINPCYAIDAAYLSSNSDFSEVKVMLSGYVGYVNAKDVKLKPISQISNRPSMYYVKDGEISHSIKTQFNIDYYTKNLPLSEIKLSDGAYYSYDGQYFYRDFKVMIDDYRKNTRELSINESFPYYNYYMYLPFRSLSTYDVTELETYFYDELKLNKRLQDFNDLNGDGANDVVNESELYGLIDEFVAYQYHYGNNALLSLAMSIHESNFGKSLEAFEKNNLFGEYAFNGEYERHHHKYRELESSIYAHMRFIMSDRYLNYKDENYEGGYLGNLQSGINLNYSSDPYWGEKVASNAYQIDKNLGLKDYGAAKIGISKNKISLYNDENLSSYYDSLTANIIALNIVGESDKAYKVMLDYPSDEETMTYDYQKQVKYVAKDQITNLQGTTSKIKYKNVIYDANGGKYYGGTKLSLKLPFSAKIPNIKPFKDGYYFNGYEEVITNDSYLMKAKYLKIETMTLKKPAMQIVNYGDNLNLKAYSLNLKLEDGSNKKIPLTYEMLDGYDKYKSGVQTINVTYAGMKEIFEVKVSDDLSAIRQAYNDKVNQIIDDYDRSREFDISELMHNLYKLKKHEAKVDINRLTKLDKMMMNYYGDDISICIDDNPFDASITGLAFLAGSLEYYDFDLGIFSNAYRMSFDPIDTNHITMIKNLVKNYGFKYETSMKLAFYKNYDEIEANFPFTVQIKLDKIDSTRLHTVYRLDPNGDIVKCKSTQSSNYIRFLSDKPGEFFILSMDSNNNYAFKDKYEVLNPQNTDFFNQKATIDILKMASVAIVDEIMLMVYLKLRERNKKQWRDYRKSLLNAVSLQEEKPKN